MITTCKSNIGLVRSSNQDACAGGILSDGAAWIIVCDGMGGANGGNIASKMAVDFVAAHIQAEYGQVHVADSAEYIKNMLTAAVYGANSAIYDEACRNEELAGMGTTLVAVLVTGGIAHIVHAGDSRAYLITEDSASQITVDHSVVQELVNSGNITEKEARSHPRKNIITRAVGVQDMVDVDYNEIPFNSGNSLLACTDGLSNYLNAEQLFKFCRQYKDGELADALVQFALDSGGSDNITVALIED